jgi:hypothetical protein
MILAGGKCLIMFEYYLGRRKTSGNVRI